VEQCTKVIHVPMHVCASDISCTNEMCRSLLSHDKFGSLQAKSVSPSVPFSWEQTIEICKLILVRLAVILRTISIQPFSSVPMSKVNF